MSCRMQATLVFVQMYYSGICTNVLLWYFDELDFKRD